MEPAYKCIPIIKKNKSHLKRKFTNKFICFIFLHKISLIVTTGENNRDENEIIVCKRYKIYDPPLECTSFYMIISATPNRHYSTLLILLKNKIYIDDLYN